MEKLMSTPVLSFRDVLNKFREEAFSERDKGAKFEKLMRLYLQVAPEYNGKFKEIWLWDDFPCCQKGIGVRAVHFEIGRKSMLLCESGDCIHDTENAESY